MPGYTTKPQIVSRGSLQSTTNIPGVVKRADWLESWWIERRVSRIVDPRSRDS